MSDTLDTLIHDLEEAAARLRAEEMAAADAATLVERCAQLAARIGAELDRAGRDAERDTPGQEELL